MQIRCYRCGWSFSLSREQTEFALQSAKAKGGKHSDIHCPQCRTVNKIPLKQLEQSLPPARPAPPTDPGSGGGT
jgi:phage FluMu protein Com